MTSQAINLQLTDEERLTLLRLVWAELREMPYPLSLEGERLRALADKLGDKEDPAAMTSAHE
jgi:hypothetical protein